MMGAVHVRVDSRIPVFGNDSSHPERVCLREVKIIISTGLYLTASMGEGYSSSGPVDWALELVKQLCERFENAPANGVCENFLSVSG